MNNDDKQAVTVDTLTPQWYAKYDKDDEDWEFNLADQFSGGRTGGIPLVALPDALAHTAAAVTRARADAIAELHPAWVAAHERVDKAEAALAAQAAPVAASQSNPQAATYPREIWLQAGECTPEEALPYNSGIELTWCFESIDRMDVRYVRADLAHTQHPAAVPAEPTQANAGPEPGDMPIDRFIASVPLPMYDLKEPPAGELPVLPEMKIVKYLNNGVQEFIGYTADQMREYGRLCRAAGIEEVAKIIDKETGWGWLGTQNCYQINASAIRALKGGE